MCLHNCPQNKSTALEKSKHTKLFLMTAMLVEGLGEGREGGKERRIHRFPEFMCGERAFTFRISDIFSWFVINPQTQGKLIEKKQRYFSSLMEVA